MCLGRTMFRSWGVPPNGCINSKRIELLLVDSNCRHAIDYHVTGLHQAAHRQGIRSRRRRCAKPGSGITMWSRGILGQRRCGYLWNGWFQWSSKCRQIGVMKGLLEFDFTNLQTRQHASKIRVAKQFYKSLSF